MNFDKPVASTSNGVVTYLDPSLTLSEKHQPKYTIEEGPRLSDFTRRLSKSWGRKSQEATIELSEMGETDSTKEKVLRGLIYTYVRAPEARWNSLVSTMICLTNEWGESSLKFLNKEFEIHSLTHPSTTVDLKLNFLSIFVHNFENSECEDIFENGAIAALIKKSIRLNLIDIKFPEETPQALPEATFTHKMVNDALSEIAQLSPTIKKQILDELTYLLSHWAPYEQHPEAACHAITQIYISLVTVDAITLDELYADLIEIANKSPIEISRLCGQSLAIIAHEFHILGDIFRWLLEDVDSCTHTDELRCLLNLTAEFSLYDPLIAVDYIRFLSSSMPQTSPIKASHYAEASRYVLEVFNHEFEHYTAGYISTLELIRQTPIEMLSKEDRIIHNRMIESFIRITQSMDKPSDIEKAATLITQALSNSLCHAREELTEAFMTLIRNSPYASSNGIIVALNNFPLTKKGIELLDKMYPQLCFSLESIDSLIVALGRCHCVDFCSPAETPPHKALLEKIRALRALIYQIPTNEE